MSTTRTSDQVDSRNEMRECSADRKRSGPISSAQGRVPLRAHLLCLFAVSTAFADDLLVIHTDSLTAYKPGSASSVQDIRPMAAQRGVGIDGALRAAGSFGWAMQGNPFESTIAGETLEGLRIATGRTRLWRLIWPFPLRLPGSSGARSMLARKPAEVLTGIATATRAGTGSRRASRNSSSSTTTRTAARWSWRT